MLKILKKIISIASPSRCIMCNNFINEINDGICHKCIKNFKYIEAPFCEICSQPFYYDQNEISIKEKKKITCGNCQRKKPNYDKAISVFKYNFASKKIILPLKHGDKTSYSKIIAKIIFNRFQKIINENDLITPTPIHKKRYSKRKYNQALLIANEVANLSKKKIIRDGLIRYNFKTSQGRLSTKQRIKNVSNSFKINDNEKNKFKDKNVILIDDVIATGATINECAKALKKAGAKKVIAISFAKTCL
ncbi:MAG: ComF family protein [Alphaproteobacteria bacterium]|nr:ComF family protein [Alphaproteobacteria bacterium]